MSGHILWDASRSTGVVALVLLTAVMVLGIVTAGRAEWSALPRAAVLRLHRNLSLGAVAFTAVHVATAILDGYVSLSVTAALVPFTSGYSRFWIGLGAIAGDLMIASVVTSLLRRHLSRRVWLAVHLSAYALWPLAIAHGWGTSGGDAATAWMVTVNLLCIASVVLALAVWGARRNRHADARARAAGVMSHPRDDRSLVGTSAS